MPKIFIIILAHQIIFQGMFLTKNLLLRKRIGTEIRGNNKEARNAVLVFVLFISGSLLLSLFDSHLGKIQLISKSRSEFLGVSLLLFNLMVAAASLLNLKDSWRVGVLEDQKTELITSGIYGFTRNPYFVSYLLMFAAYTILTQNAILCVLAIIGFLFVHVMIKKEEDYLLTVHGNSYMEYKSKVPRYFII